MNVARRLKALIQEATGLTASAGVAPNKFLAKIASAWRKPDGLTVIAPERVESFLQQLPVDALWGVGPVTAARLREARHRAARRRPHGRSRRCCGGGRQHDGLAAETRRRRGRPRRSSPTVPRSHRRVNAPTPQDLTDIDRIREEIAEMARENAEWLRKRGLLARTVTIKVRYDDFTTITRSHSRAATDDVDEIVQRAVALLAKTDAGRRPVRLLGAGVHGFAVPAEPADEGRLF